jgi:hypothetical protein
LNRRDAGIARKERQKRFLSAPGVLGVLTVQPVFFET